MVRGGGLCEFEEGGFDIYNLGVCIDKKRVIIINEGQCAEMGGVGAGGFVFAQVEPLRFEACGGGGGCVYKVVELLRWEGKVLVFFENVKVSARVVEGPAVVFVYNFHGGF